MQNAFSLIMRDFSAVAKRLKRKAILYAIAGILALGTYGLLLAGLAVWMGQTYGLVAALLSLSAALAAAALLIVAVSTILDRRDRRRRERSNNRNLALATLLASAIPAASKRPGTVAISAVTGLAAIWFLMGPGGPDQDSS